MSLTQTKLSKPTRNYSEKVLNEFLECQPPHLALVRAFEAEYYKKYLPFKGKILDVGCGDGFFAWSVYNRQVLDNGADIEGSLWQEAKKRGNYKRVETYDGYHLPYKDGEFDTVVSNCVLEHVPEVEKLIAEMSRVTKAGGLMAVTLVTDKFGDELLGTKMFGKKYKQWFNKKSVHQSPFAAEKWKKIFQDSGIKIIETGEYIDSSQLTKLHDISHYLGIPNLVTRKISGKWVIGLSKLTNKLWKKIFLKVMEGDQAKIESPYLFVAGKKSEPAGGHKQ